MAQSFCSHCGFGNSYAYTKPTTCAKCNRLLSFEVKNTNNLIITSTTSSSNQLPVLTTAEKSFISKNKDTMLPLEICQRIFGEQVSPLGPEAAAIRQFLNGIGKGAPYNFRQTIIDDNYVPDNNDYEEGENEENESLECLPDIKSLSFTIETGPASNSMSVEDAIFKYSIKPENKPEKLKKPKGFNAKRELAKIREQASSINKNTKTVRIKNQE